MIKRKVFQQRIVGKRNQKLLFDNERKRNEYLNDVIPIEFEQNFGNKISFEQDDYIKLLMGLQTHYGSLTLTNGTSLYIKSDNEVLLLKVLYESDSPHNIAMNCKRDFEQCSCSNCEEKRNDMHNANIKETENV